MKKRETYIHVINSNHFTVATATNTLLYHLYLCCLFSSANTSSNSYICSLVTIARKRSRYRDWLQAGRLRVWSSSPGRDKNFLFSKSSRQALGPTQPPILGALSLGLKWTGREADHSPPASIEIKKIWNYTSTPSWRSA
jgi:hypothetical protein